MQFLDVKTDFAFKRVFGSEQSKAVLLDFLNAIIDFGEDTFITDLTIVDPYQIPLLKGMKDSYVDVKAVLSNQSRVIIEMQVLNVEGFEKRVLYNAAKLYSTQLKKSEQYATLEPIIALTITDFEMFPELPKAISPNRNMSWRASPTSGYISSNMPVSWTSFRAPSLSRRCWKPLTSPTPPPSARKSWKCSSSAEISSGFSAAHWIKR